ncbi:hypothetical protein P8452_57090 [Trifolium repens]|nr:hypothetical protein P8452_57090 [Trifolium repens]
MSFGFSDKNSKLSIGQYGNGFKASSMRLGADAIVFSRHLNNGNLTELLTYKRMVSMTKMANTLSVACPNNQTRFLPNSVLDKLIWLQSFQVLLIPN